MHWHKARLIQIKDFDRYMILAVSGLYKSYDGTDILKDISFHMEANDRLAVTGINGAGKSTLLRLISGREQPDEGSISLSKDVSLAYLEQNPETDSEKTIYDEVLSAKAELLDMEEELRKLELRMKEAAEDSSELESIYDRYNRLSHEFEQRDGYAVRSNVVGMLKGLGFSEEEFGKQVSKLSGGQKTRLALARILMEEPGLLLLDEPTNHLDISSVSWLESYLRGYRGALIIVSHDRYFLDRVADKVLDIEAGRARLYVGNYTAFAEKKAIIRKDMMKAYLNNQAEIRHQQEVIEKLRRFNREKSIKRAESREKLLSRMEKVEKPFDVDDAMRLRFAPRRQSGNDVLMATGLSKAYSGRQLFSGVDLDIKRGEKVAVIGPNGTGKTTLLKIICGLVPADSGELSFGSRVETAYYDQEHHELDPTNTVFEEISDAYPDMSNTEIRNLLASFLFTGDDVFKSVGDLSGGEQGRLSLSKLMLSRANLLLLDEPTNHLDITSKDILEEAIRNYEGTVIYVSHDRYFINRTATRILELWDGSFVNYIGNYDYYLEKKADPDFDREKSLSGARTEAKEVQKDRLSESVIGIRDHIRAEESRSRQSFEEQKQRKARLQKLRTALGSCERDIKELEQQIFEIDELMTHDEIARNSAKLNELTASRTALEDRLSELYELWEQRAEELEEFTSAE